MDGGKSVIPKPMAFQHINKRMIKSFAVGQNCRHEFGWKISFEPS